jgi:hypothetical protein
MNLPIMFLLLIKRSEMLFEKQNYIKVEFYYASQVIVWQWRNLFNSICKAPKKRKQYILLALGFLPFKNDAITILLTKIIMLVVAQFDAIHVQIASLHRCGVESKDQVA